MGSDKTRNGVKNVFPEKQKKEALLPPPYVKHPKRGAPAHFFDCVVNMLSATILWF